MNRKMLDKYIKYIIYIRLFIYWKIKVNFYNSDHKIKLKMKKKIIILSELLSIFLTS
jgi:hypothetical protein